MRSAGATTLSAALLLALATTGDARAQATDTSAAMREVMERAQQNERRGVEDLIEKLSRKTSPNKDAPAVAAPPVEPLKSAASAPVSAPVVATPTPAQPTAIATPPPATAPTAETAPTPSAPPPAVIAVTPPPATAPSAAAPATAQVVTAVTAEARPSAELEIYFEFASAVISARSTQALKTLGQALTDTRLSAQKFLIAGYTDSKGKADYNLRLSQQRAEAVRDFLIKEFKVAPGRLIAKGYGKSRLKDQSNPTADANRRVQIIDWTN